MKCQHCLTREANFHYRSNINGEIAEHHLCAGCAQSVNGLFAGVTANPMRAMEEMVQKSLLGPSFFGGRSFFAPIHRDPERLSQGAEMCHREPKTERIPEAADETLQQRRMLNALRQEMQTAVEQENFERAAEIRDEINRLSA
ncbi:MAG: UvrB/UvrC motif-containing protein [Oscillospiraceae bacterium]|nr:UvrB/UvrC motif-containing protein [Oscillospiraceae bacterium]